jgi:S-formylglutathione hydrolase FrmB
MNNLLYPLVVLVVLLTAHDASSQTEPKGVRPDTAKEIPPEEMAGYIGFDPLPVSMVKFYSESLGRDMHINVVLPRGYENSGLRYPVLYLCHGYSSNLHEFEYIGVPKYLNMFDMIVVMVDVGNSSYVNYARSDDGRPHNYADHVIKDIIPFVDKNYRTIADRRGRAINGISMGGFGAMSLGLSHPDLFCSVGSHSGALNMAARYREWAREGAITPPDRPRQVDTVMRYRDISIPGFSSMKERTPMGQPFLSLEDVERVDPFTLVLRIPRDQLPHIYIDCGDKDFLITQSEDFIRLLKEHDIPFQFGRSDGTHEEDYWGREIAVSMSVQYAVMLRNIWGREFEIYDAWAGRDP